MLLPLDVSIVVVVNQRGAGQSVGGGQLTQLWIANCDPEDPQEVRCHQEALQEESLLLVVEAMVEVEVEVC